MFRTHQEFFAVHTAVVYVIQVCWHLMMDRVTVRNM